jgi:mRNA interferase RelE/StbE
MYHILIEKKVVKYLEKIDDPDFTRIKTCILNLAHNPRPQGFKKLKGRNAYRIRQGDYRIIYEVTDRILKVHIVTIGHRRDVYN